MRLVLFVLFRAFQPSRCTIILNLLKVSNIKVVSATDQFSFATAMFLSLLETCSRHLMLPPRGTHMRRKNIYSNQREMIG